MNILAMDTSMGACSVAVLGTDGTAMSLHVSEALMARGHAEALMPMVQEVLAKAGISAPELDLIAATVGPGRSEERRVGKECPQLCRSRWSPYH